ncbi:hypothetical protein FACS1894154_11020 [Betaproteobacteria bacterium]|nr:hypothetical protein FACS1894154_11020 [Betaproteobacteria bacterium]GHU22391.1 hypothetical protein FACS189488_02850 [Betaproteobacteria bacterium]
MSGARFDLSFPPFDVLSAAGKEQLAGEADILFFGSGEEILSPERKVEALYLVAKGIVGEMATDELVGVYREEDIFDSRSLLTGRVENRFVAHEETLLYALPRQAVLKAAENYPDFGAHFFTRISEKSGLSVRSGGQAEWQKLFNATLREVGVRPAVFLEASASIADAARAMREHHCRAIFVRDHERVGIFTMSNFCDVIIEEIPHHAPIGPRAHYALHCCELDEYIFSALLLMTRQNIQRVVVTEGGIPVGVLPQIDLLSFFFSHSHLVSRQIAKASDLEGLIEAGRSIDAAIGTLHSTGMKTPQLARLVQALDLRLMERLWQLVAPPEMFAQSCLLVLGSGGRGEQILKTDQDNALIFHQSLDPASVTQATEAFCAGLLKIGYPLCPGGVMANQPPWRGTVREWQARLQHWIYQPDQNTWMNLAAWLDAEVAAGDAGMLNACKQYLFEQVRDETQWLGWLAKAISQFDHLEAEHHFWRQLLHRRDEVHFDIKKGGIFPIVHGIRVLALESGIEPANTFTRLDALVYKGKIDRAFAEDLSGALAFMMKLRLDSDIDARRWGKAHDNMVDTSALSSLARDSLKESLAVTRRFKTFIQRHYQLGRF